MLVKLKYFLRVWILHFCSLFHEIINTRCIWVYTKPDNCVEIFNKWEWFISHLHNFCHTNDVPFSLLYMKLKALICKSFLHSVQVILLKEFTHIRQHIIVTVGEKKPGNLKKKTNLGPTCAWILSDGEYWLWKRTHGSVCSSLSAAS